MWRVLWNKKGIIFTLSIYEEKAKKFWKINNFYQKKLLKKITHITPTRKIISKIMSRQHLKIVNQKHIGMW